MPLLIREYRDEDWPQAAAIWSLAFFAGEPIAREHRLFRHKNAIGFVAEEEEGLVAATRLIPYRMTCRGVELSTGGVSAVAVAPEHRGQGAGSSLMHWLTGEMRKRGFALGALHAANAGFYRGFGYAYCGQRVEYHCPFTALPRFHEALPIHRLTQDDWPELARCYSAFSRRASGMVVRDGEAAEGGGLADSLAFFPKPGNGPLTVYAVGRPVEGYAALRLNTAFYERQQIAEMAWSSPRGWRALIGALRAVCINATSLAWCEPPGGPFFSHYLERSVEMRVWPPPMYRVLDVPAALQSLKPDPALAGEGSFTLAIDDELLAENRGPWRVTFGEGAVRVVEAEPGIAADLEMGIGTFTQALLGQPDLASLAAEGLAAIRSTASFSAARRLLPPHPAYCIDFF